MRRPCFCVLVGMKYTKWSFGRLEVGKAGFRTFSRAKKVRFEAAHGAKGKIVPFRGRKKYDLKVRMFPKSSVFTIC